MNRILVVEDAPEFQMLVKQTLGPSFQVRIAATGKEALELLEREEFHLLLLDLSLPDMSGLELCSRLQNSERTRDLPIMIVSGSADVTSKVTAFSIGAEDYITKPFNGLELRARVEAKLRKRTAQKEVDEQFARGPIQLNLATQQAKIVEGTVTVELSLTPREFRLLIHLARTPERVWSRGQLLDAAWGENADVYERTIDTHISALRKKMGAWGSSIESVPGVGYRFVTPVKSKAG